MSKFVACHKNYIKWWKKKLNVSDYGLLWFSFIKGLIIGLLIYHFSINVFRGHGKEYFIWKGPSGAPGSDGVGLYKSDSGSSPTKVQI